MDQEKKQTLRGQKKFKPWMIHVLVFTCFFFVLSTLSGFFCFDWLSGHASLRPKLPYPMNYVVCTTGLFAPPPIREFHDLKGAGDVPRGFQASTFSFFISITSSLFFGGIFAFLFGNFFVKFCKRIWKVIMSYEVVSRE